MRFLQTLVPSLLLLAAGAEAASSWSFDDGNLAVARKGGADATKEKLNPAKPLQKPVSFGSTDTIRVSLTAKDNGKAKRPHQAFLLLQDVDTGLEAPFPLSVKDNGKGSVDIAHKDLPVQLALASKPLRASIVVASFGSAQGLLAPVFDIEVHPDAIAAPTYDKPLRYGKLPEIHHIFRADPKSPPVVVSLVFAAAVLGAVPVLLITWVTFGANLDHLSTAFSQAPVSHGLFLGSIVAMEGVFFMYYTSWNLFTMLPVAGLVGAVTVLSGTKALGEVQSRRLAGER